MGQRIWLFPVAYSCTNRQKTGSNISLFSGNLCRKCLCCVSVYVNESNSFENVLKYKYITYTFFLGGLRTLSVSQ